MHKMLCVYAFRIQIPAGYYVTEDVAHYDEDGRCRYEGREVDIINCHGECRVASVKIENALVCFCASACGGWKQVCGSHDKMYAFTSISQLRFLTAYV